MHVDSFLVPQSSQSRRRRAPLRRFRRSQCYPNTPGSDRKYVHGEVMNRYDWYVRSKSMHVKMNETIILVRMTMIMIIMVMTVTILRHYYY